MSRLKISRPWALSISNIEGRGEGEAPQTCRLFIAIDLPENVKIGLSDMQKRLENGCRFVDAHPRWVPVDKLHLTLIFLGAVQKDRLQTVVDAMDESSSRIPPFELITGHLGLFPPDSKNPKVVSVDISGVDKSFRLLHRHLYGCLNDSGFELETREFRPHLTLARLTSVKSASRIAPLVASHASRLNIKFPVREIVLFESQSGENGPSYNAMHRTTLIKNMDDGSVSGM